MKLLEVFRMETWVVEGERESALVNRAHIMPLKIRLRPKKTARTRTSKAASPLERPMALAIEVAIEVVRSVVVLRGSC